MTTEFIAFVASTFEVILWASFTVFFFVSVLRDGHGLRKALTVAVIWPSVIFVCLVKDVREETLRGDDFEVPGVELE